MSEVRSSGTASAIIMRKNSTSHLRDGEQRRSRPDSCHKGKLKRLKTSSVGGFQRWEKENELLWAMLEDETEWLSKLFPDIVITPDLFFYALEDGVVLCRLANLIQEKAEEYGAENKVKVPGSKFKFHRTIQRKNKQLSLFKSRENVHGFLTWCRQLGISDSILFESNDIVEADECREGCREVVICLMEIARRAAAKYKLTPIPKLIQLENEIEAEERAEASNEEILYGSTDEESNDSGHGLTDGDNISPTHQHNGHNIHGTGDGKKRKKSQPKSELDKEVLKIIDNFNVYNIRKIKEGKYLILGRIIFVRMLNGHVLLRIGGGWDTLEHYLLTHLPKDVCENSDSSSELTPSVSKTPQKSQLTKLLDKVKKATPSPSRTAASQKHGESSEDDEKDITSAIRKIEFSVNQNIAVRRKHSKALLIEESAAEKTNADLIDGNYSTDINQNTIELKRSESEHIKTSTPDRSKKMESEGNRSESGFFEETNNDQVFGDEELIGVDNGGLKTTEDVLANGDMEVATPCVAEKEAVDHVDGSNVIINNNETPLIGNINVEVDNIAMTPCEQGNTAPVISDEKVIDKEQAVNGDMLHSENDDHSAFTTAGEQNNDVIVEVTAPSDDTASPQEVSVKENGIVPSETQARQNESEGEKSPKRVTSPTEKKASETAKKKTCKDAKNDVKTSVKSTTATTKKSGTPSTRPKTAPAARPASAKPLSTRPTSAATNNTKRPTTAVKTTTTTKATTTKTGKISPTSRVSPPKKAPTKPTSTITSPKNETRPSVRSPTKKPDDTPKKTGTTAKKTSDRTKQGQPLTKKATTTRAIDTTTKKTITKTMDTAPAEKIAPKKARPTTATVKKVGKVVQSKTESGLRPSSAKPANKSTTVKDPNLPVKTSSKEISTVNKPPGSKTTSKPGTATTTTAAAATSKKTSVKDTSRPQSPTKPLVRKTQTKTVTTLKTTKKNDKGEPEVQSQTIKTTRTVTETNGKKTTKTTMKEISPTGRKPFKLTTTQTIDTGKKKPTTTTVKNEKPGAKKPDSKPSRSTPTTSTTKKPKTTSKANGKVGGQLKGTIPNNKTVKELSNALGLTKPLAVQETTIETTDERNKSPEEKEVVAEIKVDKNSGDHVGTTAEIKLKTTSEQIPDEKPVECIEDKLVQPEETKVVQETPEMIENQVEQEKPVDDHLQVEPVGQVEPEETGNEQEILVEKPDEQVMEKPDEQVMDEQVMDEQVMEKPDEQVEGKPDEPEKLEEQVEQLPDKQVEEKPDEHVEYKPDESKKPDEQVEEEPDEQVLEKPAEQVKVESDEPEKPDEPGEEKPVERAEEESDEREKLDEPEKLDEHVQAGNVEPENPEEQVEKRPDEQVDEGPDKSEYITFETEEQVAQFSTEVDQHVVNDNVIGVDSGHVVTNDEYVCIVGNSSDQPLISEELENEDPEHLQHFDDSLDDVIHVPPDQPQPEVAKGEPLVAWEAGDKEESERLGQDEGLFVEDPHEQYPVSPRAYQPFPAAFLESSADSDKETSMNENNNMSGILSPPQSDKLIDPDPFSPYRNSGPMATTTDQTSDDNLLDFEQQGTREEGEGTLVTVDDLLS